MTGFLILVKRWYNDFSVPWILIFSFPIIFNINFYGYLYSHIVFKWYVSSYIHVSCQISVSPVFYSFVPIFIPLYTIATSHHITPFGNSINHNILHSLIVWKRSPYFSRLYFLSSTPSFNSNVQSMSSFFSPSLR